MATIHQLKEWPRFTWDEATLHSVLTDIRFRQGELLGQMKALGFRYRTEASLESLTAEVMSSSAIEGSHFNSEEVRSSIARHLGMDDAEPSREDRDVEGAVEMTLDAAHHGARPLTADRLQGWQSALFPAGRNGLRKILVGHWRTPESDPMQVISGPLGRDVVRRKNIHFEAPPASRIPDEMAAFLTWFEAEQPVDPLLKAGIAHLWFLTLHPFEDGNGRIARAITELSLARAERTSQRFYSLSRQIGLEKKAYYLALETAQKGSLDITPWLGWFLGCLGRAIDAASIVLEKILRKAAVWERIHQGPPLSERQRRVINALLDGPESFLSTSRYAKLAGCSLDTALRDIAQLRQYGILVAGSAGGRSTRYKLAPLSEERR